MQIPVKEVRTSILEYSEDSSWTEEIDCKEVHFLVLRCIHDNVEIDEDGVWCRDCKNKDMTEQQAQGYMKLLNIKESDDE